MLSADHFDRLVAVTVQAEAVPAPAAAPAPALSPAKAKPGGKSSASLKKSPIGTATDAISAATRQVAETLDLAAIVTYTASGSTAMRAARERPSKPILAVSPSLRTVRRLRLVWGTQSVRSEDIVSLEDMADRACLIAHAEGYAGRGDRVAITAGVPLGTPGATNMLRLALIRQDGTGAR